MGSLKYFLVLAVIFILGCTSGTQYSKESVDRLANCLADKGIKEYGAFWCPTCAKQVKIFGDSDSIIKDRGVYVECDPRCDVPESELPKACRGIIGQTDLCLQKGIEKYPHWEFADGSILLGAQDLEVLAQKSGCELQ